MRLAAIALIALAATHLAYAENSARIYVYAQRETPARSWLPVSCGDAVVADIKRGTFFAIRVAPGRYTLGVENGIPISIEMGPGEDAYLRLDWNHHVDRPPVPALSKVRPPQAGREMTYLIYVESKRVHSDSVSKSDPRALQQPQLKTRKEP